MVARHERMMWMIECACGSVLLRLQAETLLLAETLLQAAEVDSCSAKRLGHGTEILVEYFLCHLKVWRDDLLVLQGG